ncbi:GNAT family N-acetyltransferase [Bacillus sp. CRN 9]|nr:GNAT family N-acetyltransferase [Bacillus sp. CRN 9]
MKRATFNDIYYLGRTIEENNQLTHIHYPEMLSKYDANFIQFKKMPSIEEFIIAEEKLMQFHVQNKMEHVKFYFPADKNLSDGLLIYLKQNFYVVGFLELYSIQPNNFPRISHHPDTVIEMVSDANLNAFLTLQKELDRQFGEEYAEANQKIHLKNYDDPSVAMAVAFYKGEAAGSVNVYLSEETAEIDSLSVLEKFRNKKIASRLQQAVMRRFTEKTFILVADGNDTPRDMYMKQGYDYLGVRYEAMKLIK